METYSINSDLSRSAGAHGPSSAACCATVSPGTAVQNVWHHAAITFEKTADNTGTVRLYLNGTLVGAPTPVTWALRQDLALVLGGVIAAGVPVSWTVPSLALRCAP